ncbi:MAG: cytochrome c3 family protein [Bryobacteraceae bacterium]
MQRRFLGCLGGLLAALVWAWAAPPSFSHKKHAPLKMACVACHATATSAERAGFPAVARCVTCHREMAKSLKPFSARLYKVADFVFFSHARHHAAAIVCVACHGQVNQRDVLRRERPASMKACIDCHKEHSATIACTACHELSQ